MSERALARARAGSEEAFRKLTDPYRRELQLHCYRILGSLQDAEDVLQETLLAAWRGLDQFEGRASVRAWLYRIATNRCLNALRDEGRRLPPAARTSPRSWPPPTSTGEPFWLEPYPDALLEGIADRAADVDARYETREAVGLAFVAALQHLPPRQRAVLVLRDVLGLSAAEVAEMIEATEASVNSALVRARTALEDRLGPGHRERARLPRGARERELVGRFVAAFESGDVDGVVELLTDDAWLRMPPEPFEYQGHDAIAAFLRDGARLGERGYHLVATRANGEPAFGMYVPDPHSGIARAHGIMVLTLAGDEIVELTRFGDTGLLARFGLPRTMRLG